ncbi:MAG: hypothetical protein ALECFALPRED_002917 [Alectoria fallacina]|uniref:Uncharacterized protein n=1 Tax=Alectoria fallacina TaxID=1903189 RepID=A0A8H3FIK3_9LECA|nr:MAG: hypothetical protein ALECFALPRED_002917 [Alectoria fallacina]
MSDNGLNDLAKEHKLEQDHKRELDQKHKWALGEGLPTRGHPSRRPAKPYTTSYSKAVRREVEFQQNRAAQVAKISRKHESRFDNDACTSDSSTEEDVKEASAAPEPDAGYTFSYDALRGPSKGSQILGIAVAKAVENFETKATEKLIKEEYEVVGNEKEDTHTGYAADDDDFELV